MKENIRKDYESRFEHLTSGNVSLTEVQAVYNSLLIESEDITQEITDSINRNDYVKLSQLINRRSKIEIAIENIEAAYKDELLSSFSIKDPISIELKSSVQSTRTKDKKVLHAVSYTIEKLNQLAHTLTSKTLNAITKTISFSTQLNHTAGRFLIKQAAYSLAKLADAFKKES